ncbi:calcium-binding protein [Primorskyibacter sp. S187A]|uniref:calcium-binding protein n=1 Tax=Primorskyibacter sp. S187A TaxID=3415130 RepID=UPI003C7C83D1
MKSLFLMVAALVFGLQLTVAHAQSADRVNAYVWGNSLFNHLTNDDDTTVPHWLSRLARADERRLSLSGQWVFVGQADPLVPAEPQWSFDEVRDAWNAEHTTFAEAGLDTIILNPENFVQYQAPTEPYEWNNPRNVTPVGSTLDVFNWVLEQGVDPVFYLYEGWAELGAFPPTRRKYRRYTRYALGEYHEWYRDYHAAIQAALPEADVRLIPVGSILSRLVSDGPLEDLRPTDLYSDDAPHGTATTYFIASMITYAAIYNAPPPSNFVDFDDVHEVVRERYQETADFIWEAIADDLKPRTQAALPAPSPAPTQMAQASAEAPSEPDVAMQEGPVSAKGLDNPSLAMGLNGIADWSTQHPFLDIMKTARPWTGHLPGSWGAVSEEDLRRGGHMDANGWLTSLPPDVTHVETFILTDQPEEAISLEARYRLRWEGQGDLKVGGSARVRERGENELWFTYRPNGEGLVSIGLTSVAPDDPLRNITVVREDHVEMYDAGAIFNPDFIARIADLRALRFMDWTFTNGSGKARWSERARPDHYTFVGRGVPVEYIIHLSNLVGADPWINMPHMADDDFMRRYAEVMRAGLDPRLKVYVEYSNEVWNFIFPQAVYAREQAQARWGRKASDDAWMQWAGVRAAQMADIWAEVFAEEADRLEPVIAVHTGWPGLEEPLLEAPLWVEEGNERPADRFSSYAVTGYFGYELGADEAAPMVLEWIDAAQAEARRAGEAQGLQRVALREFVRKAGLSQLYDPVAEHLRSKSLPHLTQELWPHHASVAQRYGMKMIMYEGGTHVAPSGAWVSNEELSAFLQEVNYAPQMGEIYGDLLQSWRDVGGTLFNAFVDIAPPSQYGSWGALRHIDDTTSRWDALLAFNERAPAWWGDRDAAAFLHGVHLTGSSESEVLEGTTEEDVILAGPGDDTLLTLGGADVVHGGDGDDTAVFPGALADYAVSRDGPRLRLAKGGRVTQLTSVEFLQFNDVTIPADSL